VCGDWLRAMGTYVCEVVSSVCYCPSHPVVFAVVRKTCVLVGVIAMRLMHSTVLTLYTLCFCVHGAVYVCLCSSCKIDITLSKQKLSFSKALSLV
jgi:hypothetical protein